MAQRPQLHEATFYELMWRAHSSGQRFPLPFWTQQYFRRWTNAFDGGLFDTKEGAFASNAFYRYWSMVGVKDHTQESLVGQAGEIEPVYDKYTLSFFVHDSQSNRLHFPQFPRQVGDRPGLAQSLEDGYLPIIVTRYRPMAGVEIQQKVLATVLGPRHRSVVVSRFEATLSPGATAPGTLWLGVCVAPFGPTGFERHDKAGRTSADRRLGFLRYNPGDRLVEVNANWGPVFDKPPAQFGLYGNPFANPDPQAYLDHGPFEVLAAGAPLNGAEETHDHLAGLCQAVFLWRLDLTDAAPVFSLDVKLPVDDYRGTDDLRELQAAPSAGLEVANRDYWRDKLDNSGFQLRLPPSIAHKWNLYRTCRANLLILADNGQIHPGPTIYDSFWIRDSSIESIACTMAGDALLADRQLGTHYPATFTFDDIQHGPVSLCGFFGGEHEKNDHEWDSNGQALWAFGRFDRFQGAAAFGSRVFNPYVVMGARWLDRNRTEFGLLPSGWSAEHIGDKDKPHYWDDFWAVAGLYEAARLAERLGAPQTQDLWNIFDSVKNATAASIRWVLGEQARRGLWETFIPTGPGDIGRRDSTMIGTAAYFHPCRLHIGQKLGAEVDFAARATLETIYGNFISGGFEHNAAWTTYGPYLTLQLAHAFLFVGDIEKMAALLAWSEGAAFPTVGNADGSHRWTAAQGAWNEQHCYPVATEFARFPGWSWYMGDMPHGWAAAEYIALLRDMCFFEADEDSDPHIFIAPGLLPGWLDADHPIVVENAPTTFGGPFGYRLQVDASNRRVDLEITQAPPRPVRYVLPWRFPWPIGSVTTNSGAFRIEGGAIHLPVGVNRTTVHGG